MEFTYLVPFGRWINSLVCLFSKKKRRRKKTTQLDHSFVFYASLLIAVHFVVVVRYCMMYKGCGLWLAKERLKIAVCTDNGSAWGLGPTGPDRQAHKTSLTFKANFPPLPSSFLHTRHVSTAPVQTLLGYLRTHRFFSLPPSLSVSLALVSLTGFLIGGWGLKLLPDWLGSGLRWRYVLGTMTQTVTWNQWSPGPCQCLFEVDFLFLSLFLLLLLVFLIFYIFYLILICITVILFAVGCYVYVSAVVSLM